MKSSFIAAENQDIDHVKTPRQIESNQHSNYHSEEIVSPEDEKEESDTEENDDIEEHRTDKEAAVDLTPINSKDDVMQMLSDMTVTKTMN